MNRFWQDRPTLVTGASGLVGGWLVSRLVGGRGRRRVPGARLGAAGRTAAQADWTSRVRIVRGDICDQPLVERMLGEYEVNTVFHLAAQAIVGVANRNPVSTFESNIRGTWSVLEACRRSPGVKQIVTASSDKAYGDQEELPYREEAPLAGSASVRRQQVVRRPDRPQLRRDLRPAGGDHALRQFFWRRRLELESHRAGTIRAVLRGLCPIIRSDGLFIRDYFYVDDGAAAYMLLAEQLSERAELRGEAFNFSNEMQITVLELVNEILRLMDVDMTPQVLSQAPHEIRHQYLSAAKARRMLSWRPLYSLEQGLQHTIDWYKNFLEQGSCTTYSLSADLAAKSA